MEKFWTIIIILIQLNYTIVGSVTIDPKFSPVCTDIENSFDLVAIFSDAHHTIHTPESKEEHKHHEAIETSVVETEYFDNTSFDLIANISNPVTDLTFSEYYLQHLPLVFEKINIPPPRI
jgi:hypothetical protein